MDFRCLKNAGKIDFFMKTNYKIPKICQKMFDQFYFRRLIVFVFAFLNLFLSEVDFTYIQEKKLKLPISKVLQ